MRFVILEKARQYIRKKPVKYLKKEKTATGWKYVYEEDKKKIDLDRTEFVKTFLEQISKQIGDRKDLKYSSIEDFVLKEGQGFKEKAGNVKTGQMGECFKNAFKLWESDRRKFDYVEGYAVVGNLPVPVLHAWCVDKEGVVYDPTWKDGRGYYGVKLKDEYIYRTLVARKKYGIIDNIEERFPILTGKHKREEFKIMKKQNE